MGAFIDLTGQKFGRLTVIRLSNKKQKKILLWECECDCGGLNTTTAAALKTGNTLSCGCVKKDLLIKRNTKHGFSNTRIYEIWQGMIKRCTNPNCLAYPYYGGRGITVCDRWLNFIYFYEDTIDGYADDLSLDRFPNTDGNYEQTNFRWATDEQQANNKTDNRVVEFNGEKLTISEWASKIGLQYRTVISRLNNGWDIEKALTLPVQKITNNRRDFKGKHLYEVK